MRKHRSYLPAVKRLATLSASLGLASLTLLGSPALGLALETMTSDNYSVQMGNFNMTSGTKSSDSFTLTDTVGELAPGQFDSAGFTVFSGFQYIYALPEFSFRITDLSMELGVLQPGTFGTDSHELIISTRSAGYTILARAQHVLRTNQGSEIPFTNCDSPCTISSAEPWANPANTGFGFNALGPHAAADFATPNYFRPFADAEQAEVAQTIASHGSIVKDDSITVTYQASAGQSQGAGMYTTVVDYTAVPNY
jgi:hypothetical protein